jgi:hypothetical protein
MIGGAIEPGNLHRLNALQNDSLRLHAKSLIKGCLSQYQYQEIVLNYLPKGD